MKAAGIVILFPLISVIIVSLYVHSGAFRTAALMLLAASLVGVLASLVWKQIRLQNGNEALETVMKLLRRPADKSE
jgi:uncharacterized membrane protein